jgi:hypothetical protein
VRDLFGDAHGRLLRESSAGASGCWPVSGSAGVGGGRVGQVLSKRLKNER